MKRGLRIAIYLPLGIAGCLLLILLIRTGILQPLRQADLQIAQIQQKLLNAQKERTRFLQAQAELDRYKTNLFGATVQQASAALGVLIDHAIRAAGLQETKFSRTPVGPRQLRGAAEIGWTVQGEGPLPKLIDLLFLLNQDPRLHKLRYITLNAGSRPDRVRIRFEYSTLVFTPSPPIPPHKEPQLASLVDEHRLRYRGIEQRNLLLPYIPPPPPTTTVATTSSESHESSAPSKPTSPPSTSQNPSDWRVISLSEWAGQKEIHFRNLSDGKIYRFHPGDTLLGFRLVDIDFAVRPRLDQPDLLSYCRLILERDGHYFVLECGQTLADRHPIPIQPIAQNIHP